MIILTLHPVELNPLYLQPPSDWMNSCVVVAVVVVVRCLWLLVAVMVVVKVVGVVI